MNTTMKLLGLLLAMGLLLTGCEKKDTQNTPTEKNSQVTPASTAGTQTTCPIMKGNKINQEHFVDYNGKRVYFCCPGCDKKFKEEPEKYITQMESEGIVLAKTPATTP